MIFRRMTLRLAAGLVAGASAVVLLPRVVAQQPARLIAHFPLTTDLNDATGNHPPIRASNAPIVPAKGIFCNGLIPRPPVEGCDVRTPALSGLSFSSLSMSAQFFISRMRTLTNPVFVGGPTYRWLYADLGDRGRVRLGYNSNQFAECSVKYRVGVWHEVTITFDGRAATLYLDGVRGCSATTTLNTGEQRVVLLTNTANATAFYGVLRDLRVYDGVVVPERRTPVEDRFDEPPPPNLAPVDLMLARCPTREELVSVDRDLRLSFDTDPTSDEPRACSASEGSRDLSPMQKRMYNTLLLMKQLQFDRPLPWTREPLYRWFTNAVDRIRFRADITNSSCCGPGRTMNVAMGGDGRQAIVFTDRWVEPAVRGGLDSFLLLLAHEARHADGYGHTCGTRDQAPEEMGGWGVQYYLARWLAEHTDQAFFTSGTIRYTDRAARMAAQLRTTSFCKQ